MVGSADGVATDILHPQDAEIVQGVGLGHTHARVVLVDTSPRSLTFFPFRKKPLSASKRRVRIPKGVSTRSTVFPRK
jgi:hypothetical protein